MSLKWLLGLGVGFCTACSPASGVMGPNGYEQAMAKYRLNYSDAANKKFLPEDWVVDNYAYDATKQSWKEKTGQEYRAQRLLDEDGDGTIAESEKKMENIFDLRFVNVRDNAVIWLKVHPMAASSAGLDLDVILENYANGLEGAGLFEQSTLFGIKADKARHYTTFIVKKEATRIDALPAVRGVIEIADVEKLRLDPAHRDAKAELLFAKITYLQRMPGAPRSSPWPVVVDESDTVAVYTAKRTGLLVIGYYDDAARFDAHLADLHALLAQIVIPPSAVPEPSVAPAATASAAAVSVPGAVPPPSATAPLNSVSPPNAQPEHVVPSTAATSPAM